MTGCSGGDGRLPTFPVTGSVSIDQKPGQHASVVLHPLKSEGKEPVKPRGTVQADGTFRLTTYVENDGAPAGDYQVTVELWLAGRPDEGPTSRLPPRYGKPETSQLKATVRPEPTQLQPFELSTRR